MDKYTGKRLDSRYEIQQLIGVGGMANVYKAYDIVDDRTVAIKILKEEFSSNQDFLRRFRNESKAIAMLDHPNIVKVYSVSFGDRMQYIVMEYIEGITLKQYLDQQETFSQKEAIHFTVQILQALQHAHEKGIIHRDIKPQNIMLLRDGSIKVTDFGIARFSDSQTRTMTDKAIGSVHYIAPEQARGDLTDGKTDVYSVGVMLYEMITGQLPFEADNAVSVAIMQLQAEPTPPREINPLIPEGLEEITLKAMRKKPADRYASAAAMLRDLNAFRRDPNVRFYYAYSDYVQDAEATAVPVTAAVAAAHTEERPIYQDNYTYNYYNDPAKSGGSHPEHSLEPEEKPKKKKTGLIIGICVGGAAVVAAIVIVLLFVFGGSSVSEVYLKDYTGQSWTTVKQELDSDSTLKNLNYTVEYAKSDTVAEGNIIKQSPSGGKNIKTNTQVVFTVCSGSDNVSVPDVTGKTESEAVATLTKAGFEYETKTAESDTVEAGKVIQTSPASGQKAPKGSTVTITVSSGKAKVKVPDVVGDTLETAKTKLSAANLTTGSITYAYSDTVAENYVISTDPSANTEVSANSTVAMVVSKGKEQKVTTLYVSVALPSTAKGNLNLVATMDGSVVYTDTVAASAGNYTMEITGEGTKDLSVSLNGHLYATYSLNFDKGTVTQTGSYQYQDDTSSGSESHTE